MRNGSCGSVYAANCRLIGFEDIKNGFMREGWEYKRLNEVCDKGSSNIVISKLTDNHGEYPLFGASGLVKNIDFYHQESPYIGIVKDGAGVGRVNIYPAYSSLVGTMQYIYPKEGHSLDYIKYFLVKLDLSHLVSGATIPHIYFKDYGKEIIPLPPKSVQLEIVSELDQINELIRLKKEQLKDYDNLAQSIFYEMFGDPVENDKGWEVYLWAELYDTILGKMLDQKKQIETDVQLPYLGNTNVMWGHFDLENLKVMSFSEKEIKKLQLHIGDLLICEGGESGRCAIWKRSDSKILFQKAIHRARAKVDSIIPEYTMFWLRNIKQLGGLKNYISKSTIEHLTGKKLNSIPVPLPPLPLQQEFSSRISQIERQKAEVSNAIADLETLLASRMQYWFE